jgi:Calx-beta domain-containing protein
VNICQDETSEGDEAFVLNLTDATSTCVAPCSVTSATIADDQGVAAIIDDETLPALTIGNGSGPEGPAGTSNMSFSVGLSAPTSKTVTVHYTTADGTAAAGSDYAAKAGDVTFAPNTTTAQTINITINGDTTSELDETFFVNLSNPVNAKVADPQGVGTILSDDAPPAGSNSFIINDITRVEGNGGTSPHTPFTFTVSLGQAPGAGHTATVNFQTADGTATAPGDYTFANGTLSFANTETAKTITVLVVGDTAPEPDETFFANLSGADCSTTTTSCNVPAILDNQGKANLNNDDAASSPSPSPSSSPGATITPTLKVGGYFQARVTAATPCQAGRTIKVKKSVPGTDRVMVTGTTNSDGVYKQAVRPKKTGKFYSQVYNITKEGPSGTVLCKGGKSAVRTLPA